MSDTDTDDGYLIDPSPEQLRALGLEANGQIARENFDLGSYQAFHWCIFEHDLEPHELENLAAYFEEWHRPSVEGARGVLNKAGRGLFKSTDSGGFLLFAIGHYPHLSHMIIQARDDDAQKTGKLIADTIESNIGWRSCFPSIVPDPDRGWSQNGYNVKDMSVAYEDWVQKVMSDHKRDSTFMSVSVQAGAIGSHPTGVLLLDDIHDTKNTESLAEMAKVIKTVKADIIPTMTRPGRKPLMVMAYTPWKSDDAYAMLEASGIFRQLITPAFVEINDEDYVKGHPNYAVFPWEKKVGDQTFRGDKVYLTCPKVYSAKALEQQMKILGKREFARQLLCRLDVGKGESLPYYSYVLTGNELEYPMTGGCDPAGVEADKIEEGNKRSFFALAYVARLPQGGALVLDGVLEQCSHNDGQNYILGAQNRFPQWTFTMIESAGIGAAFFQLCRRDQRLVVVESNLKGLDEGRITGKYDRILQMAKWFENGTIKIAARSTPFLDNLRYLFEHFYELNKNTPHPAWDAGDATYHALKGIPEILQMQALPMDLPKPGRGMTRQNSLGSVWNSLGRK